MEDLNKNDLEYFENLKELDTKSSDIKIINQDECGYLERGKLFKLVNFSFSKTYLVTVLKVESQNLNVIQSISRHISIQRSKITLGCSISNYPPIEQYFYTIISIEEWPRIEGKI